MPDGGRLTLDGRQRSGDLDKPMSSHQDGWVTLTFADTGVGISPETVKNIFNPFFTTKDRGTGLGLAITHKVITEHGGHIEVVSRVGEGSSFIVYLPACKREVSSDSSLTTVAYILPFKLCTNFAQSCLCSIFFAAIMALYYAFAGHFPVERGFGILFVFDNSQRASILVFFPYHLALLAAHQGRASRSE